ncbi:ML domain-containing protein [Trichonephila inaurata madagascariensis]|uniref:ML domain-containing protein n=1 Tax=Trichonephila inaurata madagascariensis TaxID=2747483 RepID=A0A8X6XRB0_9ARAC|nr:ML domain-containing protein [Trichonephila inaurata madagascariensis]
MEHLGLILAVFAVLCGTSLGGFFRFEECTGKLRIANVGKFEISPDPVNLRKNMTVTMDLDILRDVPEGAMLKTRYYKLKRVFGVNIDVPIPCLLGKFGSCTISLCKYLTMFRQQAEPLFPEGSEYGCPVKAGRYGGENMEIQIPDMGSIARMIVSGRYRTELELLVEGKSVACYKILSEMK